jgi:hypothetical protein
VSDSSEGPRIGVTVELRVPEGANAEAARRAAAGVRETGFRLDRDYEPVPMSPPSDRRAELETAGETLYLVRGDVAESAIAELEARPEVFGVWREGRIEPFG